MAGADPLLMCAVGGALLGGFFGTAEMIQVVSRQRLVAAAGTSENWMSALIARRLRNGFRPLLGVASFVTSRRQGAKLFSAACRMCGERELTTQERELCSCVLGALSVVFCLGGLITRSVFGGIAAALLVACVLVLRVKSWREHRGDTLREGIPEALRSMSACSQSGLSLEQTLKTVASESKGDLRTVFERAVHVLTTGGGVTRALREMRGDDSVPELSFVAVALAVQHESGGGMSKVLDAARDMVESELELKRSLRVQTAQARLSARVVTVMPFVMMILLSLLSEDFLSPFFSSAWGLLVLAFALLMQAAGVIAVRRLLKVDD